MKDFKIALTGNPNSGKTTIFNNLTGAKQKTGNYPGVTVERITGICNIDGRKIEVIDLPGTYSLSANSPEEIVARDVIITEKPNLVIDVIDSTNLERSLYLAIQLAEIGIPYLLVLNMWDEFETQNMSLDVKKLETTLDTKVICTVGHKHKAVDILKKAISAQMNKKSEFIPNYSQTTEQLVDEVATILGDGNVVDNRWLALKFIEEEGEGVKEYIASEDKVGTATMRVNKDKMPDVTAERYELIGKICKECGLKKKSNKKTLTDKIDSVVTSKYLGIPIFFALMYLVFKLTFVVGDPLMGWIEEGMGALGDLVASFWSEGSESLLKSLLVDGVIGGVGGVLVFLPNILLLFLAIALLEGTGYMARASFIMDRLMKSLGLHGNSFIPMLIGFGCTIPAIMATRTLPNKKDRFTTIMVAPLMSCGARLPIYALMIPAFFVEKHQALVLWCIYLSGIILAIILAKILRSTVFKGDSDTYILELPPYRIPTLKSIMLQMWSRAVVYLQKAGTIILWISIIMWVFITFPQSDKIDQNYEQKVAAIEAQQLPESDEGAILEELEMQYQSDVLAYSITGRIGKAMEPVIKPLGFDWKIGSALIGAFAAKEVFVAQLGIVYSVGEVDEESETLREKLKSNYSVIQAISIILFCLISAPCMATIAVTKRETNSWKWALIQLAGLTAVAYIISLLVYQIGSLIIG